MKNKKSLKIICISSGVLSGLSSILSIVGCVLPTPNFTITCLLLFFVNLVICGVCSVALNKYPTQININYPDNEDQTNKIVENKTQKTFTTNVNDEKYNKYKEQKQIKEIKELYGISIDLKINDSINDTIAKLFIAGLSNSQIINLFDVGILDKKNKDICEIQDILNNKDYVVNEYREKKFKEEQNKLTNKLKKGIYPVIHTKLWLSDIYEKDDEDFIKEYDNNVNLAYKTISKSYEIFCKYCDDEKINLILNNFFIENKDIADYGSFNPFIFDSDYFTNLKMYDNSGYVFDICLPIKNALNKFKLKNANLDEVKKNIIIDKHSDSYGILKIRDLKYNDLEHEKFIDLMNCAYSAMSYTDNSDDENEYTFILPNMINSLKNAFEYAPDIPIEIFQLAIHLFINGYKWDYDIKEKEEKLAFECLKQIYGRIKSIYNPVILLKNGLKNKYKDINDLSFFIILQYKLNQYKLNKVKNTIEELDLINYDNDGLNLEDNESSYKNIEYFYNKKYSVEDVIKIDKLLDKKSLGTELIELVKVDEDFNIIDKEKYSYLKNKYSELKGNDYINHLSDINFKSSSNKISIAEIDLMNGYEFEKLVKKLFQKIGYEAYTTKESNDQGIDVIAKKGDITIAIQVKCYSQPVGNHAIMEAVAGMKFYDADKAMVVTNNIFTRSAIELAKKNNVQLWDRKILIEKINEVMWWLKK